MRYLILLALLCSSCVVGVFNPTPTATKPVLPTLTATDAPEPTPTSEEPLCNPKYAATIFIGFADVYANPDLTVKMLNEEGHPIILEYGREVLLLETSVYGYRVVTRYGERVDGWIAYYALPVECRP